MVYYLRHGDGPVFFEFDETKSAANKHKHGIDFVEAQQLWADPKWVQLRARSTDEDRFMVIGVIGERHWTAFITMRGERIRLISVRRAREQEVLTYGRSDG
ncbi:MAG TPA: BrnT family toxin [Coriobacteriia bacterium]